MSLRRTIQTMVADAMRIRAMREEAELKRMLGCWVSELEPVVLRSATTGELMGLTMDGIPLGVTAPIIVRAWA